MRIKRGWRIDKLMAAGFTRDDALEVAARQARSDYQRRRYRNDAEFRERKKRAASNSYKTRKIKYKNNP